MAAGGLLDRNTVRYEATLRPLEPRPEDVKSTAIGQFVGIYHKYRRVLVWGIRFGDLTGPATAVDIHVGMKGKGGPLLLHLCAPCSNPSGGTVRLTLAQAAAFRKKTKMPLYVNLRTVANRAGEIRGQLASIELGQGCAPC